jgi:DNA mismatch endonuclease (patch repair protein)
MSRVRSKDTSPELVVRSLVHRMGYRFRLHRRSLPGTPDLVFPNRRKVIFVHGCFWHRHRNGRCPNARLPKSRRQFWERKLDANRVRDFKHYRLLRRLGWAVMVVWECELKHKEHLENIIVDFLERDQ